MSKQDIADLMTSPPFGTVFPPGPPLVFDDKGAREHALERLREFICSLVFQRTGAPNEPSIAFMVKKSSIHVYQPDNVRNLQFPSIAFLPARGDNEPFGLGPPQILDETVDKFGPGTALLRRGEYQETFIIEVVASKQATRRAIVSGLQEALRLQQNSYSLRLSLPNYFDLPVQFTLMQTEYIDDVYAVQNRRRAHLFVEMRVCEVAVVNVKQQAASVDVRVFPGVALRVRPTAPEIFDVSEDLEC